MAKTSYFLAIVLFLLSQGSRADNIVDGIVARVNDSIITHADLEKGNAQAQEDLKQQFPSDWQSKWTQRQKDVLRDLIDRQLLIEKGKDLGLTGETETLKKMNELRKQLGLATMDDLEKAMRQQGIVYEDFREQTRENIVTEQVLGREVGSHIHIGSDEIQAWSRQHANESANLQSVKLAEILVSTQPPKPADKGEDSDSNPLLPEDSSKMAQAQAKANDLLDQLHKGARFEDLAQKYSDGSTAVLGGAIGEFQHGQMDKSLEDKIFPLKVGETTGVIRTKQGFTIFKVLDRPDVQDKIRNIIYAQKLEPAARAYLTRLREDTYIEVRDGYVDTGASPNEVKPDLLATDSNSADETKPEKKKKAK